MSKRFGLTNDLKLTFLERLEIAFLWVFGYNTARVMPALEDVADYRRLLDKRLLPGRFHEAVDRWMYHSLIYRSDVYYNYVHFTDVCYVLANVDLHLARGNLVAFYSRYDEHRELTGIGVRFDPYHGPAEGYAHALLQYQKIAEERVEAMPIEEVSDVVLISDVVSRQFTPSQKGAI